jgi:hypothetical protein
MEDASFAPGSDESVLAAIGFDDFRSDGIQYVRSTLFQHELFLDLFLLDASMDFFAINAHIAWGRNTDLNPAWANTYDCELDFITNDDRFALPTC